MDPRRSELCDYVAGTVTHAAVVLSVTPRGDTGNRAVEPGTLTASDRAAHLFTPSIHSLMLAGERESVLL